LAWTQGLHLEPLHQPSCVGFFEILSWTICLGWLGIAVLLILRCLLYYSSFLPKYELLGFKNCFLIFKLILFPSPCFA
jgi:hypothetical protein